MRALFDNLKIGKKLVISFAVIICLYIITVSVSVVNIKSISRGMEKLYEEPFANVQYSLGIYGKMQGVGREMLKLATNESETILAEDVQSIKDSISKLEEQVVLLKTGYVSDKEKVAEFEAEYKKLVPSRTEILNNLESDDRKKALEVYYGTYEAQAQIVRNLVSEIAGLTETDVKVRLEENSRFCNMVLLLILSLAGICILFSIILGYLITRSITVPVNHVKKAANAIANGQLNADITYHSDNELGELADDIRNTAQALNRYVSEIQKGMTALGKGELHYRPGIEFKGDFGAVGEAMIHIGTMLRDSMQQIASSSEQVSVGAEQVSNGSQALAHGASEQASSIEELAVSINDIADIVKENAESAVKSSEFAESVGQEIQESNMRMEDLKECIHQIKKNSSEIRGIVKEIEDIAFQTNILALNAAVEAARAGEAGRGFSAVASEVRRLAAKTTGASKLTADLAEKNSIAVENGINSVNDTALLLKKSVAGSGQVVKMSDKISETSIQQADAISQIRRSVELISEIVQGNSATSEESAAASEELFAQAQILKELVEKFEL